RLPSPQAVQTDALAGTRVLPIRLLQVPDDFEVRGEQRRPANVAQSAGDRPADAEEFPPVQWSAALLREHVNLLRAEGLPSVTRQLTFCGRFAFLFRAR